MDFWGVKRLLHRLKRIKLRWYISGRLKQHHLVSISTILPIFQIYIEGLSLFESSSCEMFFLAAPQILSLWKMLRKECIFALSDWKYTQGPFVTFFIWGNMAEGIFIHESRLNIYYFFFKFKMLLCSDDNVSDIYIF